MKSKEELNKIKEEVEAVNEKLAELTEEEIAQVNGGVVPQHGGIRHDNIESDTIFIGPHSFVKAPLK